MLRMIIRSIVEAARGLDNISDHLRAGHGGLKVASQRKDRHLRCIDWYDLLPRGSSRNCLFSLLVPHTQ
jgi:hypothetical protein